MGDNPAGAMLTAKCGHKGAVYSDVQVARTPTGKLSDQVTAMKAEIMQGMNAFAAQHQLNNDDVELLEEQPEEDEEAGKTAAKGKQRNKKRKQPPTTA